MAAKAFIANPTKFLKSATVDVLENMLRSASKAYYNTSTTEMSDHLFDMAKDRLEELDPTNPFLSEVGAEIGAEAAETSTKVDLPYWMGSLDKVRDSDKGIAKWTHDYPGEVVISDKLDGNSGMLVYNKSSISLYTRGNGFKGQNISHMLALGLNVPGWRQGGEQVAVRGELIISKAKWNPAFGANPRNVLAGILHTKAPDPKMVALVDFVVYELLHPKLPHVEALEFMKAAGFNVVHYKFLDANSAAAMNTEVLSRELLQRRVESPYEIDGIVVSHNAVHKTIKGKNPKYAFAFKTVLTHEEAEVIVSHVEWNISKDGYLKPIVHFGTVALNGVNISKATGFNAAFIESKRIGPGACVVIIRSGDVIPFITRVTTPSQPQLPSFEEFGEYEWTDKHVDIRVKLKTGETTKEQTVKILEHFAKTMEIKFVSSGTLKKFVEQGGITTSAALLHMTRTDIMKIDGFKEASATKVYNSLQETLSSGGCVEFMTASGLFGRGFGSRKIEAVLAVCPEILAGGTPTVEKVAGVVGVGPATAKAFVAALPAYFEFLKEIGVKRCATPKKSPVNVSPHTPHMPHKSPSKTVHLHPLHGMAIVFTGFRNSDWEKVIKAAGGKTSTSISKSTNLVVATNPTDTSTKLTKARELGVRIISKDEFEKML